MTPEQSFQRNIVLFGGTGGTGHYLLPDLLDRGFSVTAIVRYVSKIPTELTQKYPSQLTVVQANVLEPNKYESYIAKCDVVVSCLGFDNLKATTVLSTGMKHIVSCMKKHGVKRILTISSAGCNSSDPNLPLYFKWLILPYILYETHEELKRMDQVILDQAQEDGESLRFTIVRPPRLLNKPLTQVYRASVDGLQSGGASINKSDLAYAMANMIELDQFENSIVYVSN